jgi:ribosomal protein S24E
MNQSFYLKEPPSNQSPAHYFLTELIAEELRVHFGAVKTSNTVRADIEFSYNNQKYALEIETEHDIEKDKEKLLVKSALLEGDYGQNWWFVVTKTETKPEYEKYGKTLTRTEIRQWIQQIKGAEENVS